MNDRLTVALAVTGGYVLGRTRKAKLALGVATLVAGTRLKYAPRALTRLATEQLEAYPQFAEVAEQLRDDLRGTGRAATGALVNRQVNALADRLHERTRDIRDRLDGAAAADTDDSRAFAAAKKTGGTAEKDAGGKETVGVGKETAGVGKKDAGTEKKTAGTAKKTTGTAKKTAGTAKRAGGRAPAKKSASATGSGSKAGSSSRSTSSASKGRAASSAGSASGRTGGGAKAKEGRSRG
ncbi:DNA primase [Streptomyces albus subsp. chlorinus]|uniref:DNA primase n=1 Tax=Streptomyces albus TaxID=1888 RepID=UPI00156ECDA7|nr:DNA primase [Streptomyces albus]NSC20815.1 DNA primase [Streptomyces albus subsp. chlorinus]